MIITTIILFYGLALLLVLFSILFKDLRELSIFALGFLLIIISTIGFTDGVEMRIGENATTSTRVDYIYEPIDDFAKVTFSGFNLALGFGLFFSAFTIRKKRIEDDY